MIQITQSEAAKNTTSGYTHTPEPTRGGEDWPTEALHQAFQVSMADYKAGRRSSPPPTPQEVKELLECGKFEPAVRRLSFIFSFSLLKERWNERLQGAPSSVESRLERAVRAPNDLGLSNAEHAVATMLWILSSKDYSSEHPSTKALEMVEQYTDQLNNAINPAFNSGGSKSYRVQGAASLLLAAASLQEEHQPCGIEVLRAAKQRGIQRRILLSSHHVIGGDAVPLITEFCLKEQLLSCGEIWNDRQLEPPPNPAVYCFRKEVADHWTAPMQALKSEGDILIVEDELIRNDDGEMVDVRGLIQAAYQQSGRTGLRFASNLAEAVDIMNSHEIAAVGSDLYFPAARPTIGGAGSLASLETKDVGVRLVKEILCPFLATEVIHGLLQSLRELEVSILKDLRHQLDRLIQG